MSLHAPKAIVTVATVPPPPAKKALDVDCDEWPDGLFEREFTFEEIATYTQSSSAHRLQTGPKLILLEKKMSECCGWASYQSHMHTLSSSHIE